MRRISNAASMSGWDVPLCDANVVAELAIMVFKAPTPSPPICAMHLAHVINASPAHRCISPKAGSPVASSAEAAMRLSAPPAHRSMTSSAASSPRSLAASRVAALSAMARSSGGSWPFTWSMAHCRQRDMR